MLLVTILTGMKQLRFTWLSRHICFRKIKTKWDMIRLLKIIYLYISQSSLYCIVLYVLPPQ